jgi:tRNA modification GTPase
VVAAMLAALDACGLTAAAAGDFTRRAFDNGKLDLGQVEALGDLVAAETDGQRRAALARSGGDLAQHVDRWRALLTGVRADIEATLDFAEDEGVSIEMSMADRAALGDLVDELSAMRAAADRGAALRDGVTIAIVGPVNAGKSTLLNALARRDAAMVSPLPGTTRDIVEVRLALDGALAILFDTAGLRTTDDRLEAEGIRRGVARAAAADIVVALGPSDRSDAIVIAAKSDLRDGAGWRDGVLHLSAATGDGIDLLEAELMRRIATIARQGEPPIVAHRWQKEALDAATSAVNEALAASDIVLIADALRVATAALERLIGRVATEEVLGRIFARFCIGK